MLQDILTRLQDTWGYTQEELSDIEMELVNYGLACCVDSEVRKEAEEKSLEFSEN